VVQTTTQSINMLHQKYIAKQMNVCRGYRLIVAVGESKSTVRSAEFHWYKLKTWKQLITTNST